MSSGRVRVIVRIRPFNRNELVDGGGVGIHSQGSSVFLQNNTSYLFDSVLSPDSTQKDVSDAVLGDLMSKFIQGYNCTVFAYGQTGAGKSYTIGIPNQSSLSYVEACFGADGNKDADTGANTNLDANPEQDPELACAGLIPRFIVLLFKELEQMQTLWKINVSFLEVYNETLRDLLSPGTDPASLCIRDHKGKIAVQNLCEREVTSAKEATKLFVNGGLLRITAVTNMNERSSRSHSIFTITLSRVENDRKFVSKFSFIDLAGSERAKKSGATGLQFKEMIGINSGLLALGNVISALATNQSSSEKRHVPYRDSKLTRLLQDSLGGNSETVMIANVSPYTGNFDESNSTILYAARARNIINNPAAYSEELSLGQAQDQVRRLIKELEQENATAKADLARVRQQRDNLRSELSILEAQLLESNERLMAMAKTTMSGAPGDSQQQEQGLVGDGGDTGTGTTDTVRDIVRSYCLSMEQGLRTCYSPVKVQTIQLLLDTLTNYVCRVYQISGNNYNEALDTIFNPEIVRLIQKPGDKKETDSASVNTNINVSASANANANMSPSADGNDRPLKNMPSRKKLTSSKQSLRIESTRTVSSDPTVTAIFNALLLLRKPVVSNARPRKKGAKKGTKIAKKPTGFDLEQEIADKDGTHVSEVLSEQPIPGSFVGNDSVSSSSVKYSMLNKSTSSDTSLVDINGFLDRSGLEQEQHDNNGDNNGDNDGEATGASGKQKQDLYDLAYKDLVDNVKNVPEESQALSVIKDLIKHLITKEAHPAEIYHTTVTAMMALQKQQEHILELEGQIAYIQQKIQGKTEDGNAKELRDRIKILEEEHRAALDELRTKEKIQLAMDQVQARFQSTLAKYKKELAERTRAYEEANRLLKSQSMHTMNRISADGFVEHKQKEYGAGVNRQSHRRTCSNVENSFSKLGSVCENGDTPRLTHQMSFSHVSRVSRISEGGENNQDSKRANGGGRSTKMSEIDKKLEDLQSLYTYNARNEEMLKQKVKVLEEEKNTLEKDKSRLEKRVSQLEHDLKLKVMSPARAVTDGLSRAKQAQPAQQIRVRQSALSTHASQGPGCQGAKGREADEHKNLQLQGMPVNNAQKRKV